MKEIWKPAPNFEGWYEVSSLGNIRRILAGRNTHVNRPMKFQTHNDGYVFVEFSKNGIGKKLQVSRLICEAFHGPCPTGMNCNHKDGVKANNSASNLEWMTHSDNCKHKYNVLGHSLEAFRNANPWTGLKGAKHPGAKSYVLTNPDGDEIRITGLKEFCRQNNLRFGPLSGMAAGSNKSKHHKGWSCRRA